MEILSKNPNICECAIIESALVMPMDFTYKMIEPIFNLSYCLISKKWFSKLQLTIRQMQEAEGVTEALKAADQLEWVRRMNSIRNRAEEIIKTELIFV